MIKQLQIYLLLLAPLTSVAFQSELSANIESITKKYIQKYKLPGFAIAITTSDSILYKNAFGIQNIHTKEPVTTKTMFHMASVTKTFVATALMQLQEQGKLNIDEPIVKYLPYFKLVDDRYKIITIRQALSHISGMPDFDSNPWNLVQYDDKALERFVKDFVSHKFLVRNPEEKYEYCNTIYEVLGDLIAKISGISFEDYVHKNITKPIGMTSSSLLIRDIDKSNLASPHRTNKKGKHYVTDVYPYNRAHGPSSTMTSNIEEMTHYLRMYLNNGEYNGAKILNTSIINKMWSPALGKFKNIGISWHLSNQYGYKIIGHGGSDVGFKSYVMFIPKLDIGVVFMTNSITAPYKELINSLLEEIINKL